MLKQTPVLLLVLPRSVTTVLRRVKCTLALYAENI